MTYVPTDEGWLYVALVLDLYARKRVGWTMSETMAAGVDGLCALYVALGWRDPEAGPWCITATGDRNTRRASTARSSRREASLCR